MTREQVNKNLREAAEAFGFKTSEEANYQGIIEIISEELNFTYTVRTTENTDWAAHRIEQELTVTASVRKMGGQPSADELLKTADEIRRGAMLLLELRTTDLTWTEEF